MEVIRNLFQNSNIGTFSFEIGDLYFEPNYIQAFLIVFLLFLLVLTLARVRRLYVGWSLKGSWSMIFIGFFLALILEGFLIIGGRTLFTELLGWKNAPKPIGTALDTGREKLVDVLGVTEEVPMSSAQKQIDADEFVFLYQGLEPDEAQEAKRLICTP